MTHLGALLKGISLKRSRKYKKDDDSTPDKTTTAIVKSPSVNLVVSKIIGGLAASKKKKAAFYGKIRNAQQKLTIMLRKEKILSSSSSTIAAIRAFKSVASKTTIAASKSKLALSNKNSAVKAFKAVATKTAASKSKLAAAVAATKLSKTNSSAIKAFKSVAAKTTANKLKFAAAANKLSETNTLKVFKNVNKLKLAAAANKLSHKLHSKDKPAAVSAAAAALKLASSKSSRNLKAALVKSKSNVTAIMADLSHHVPHHHINTSMITTRVSKKWALIKAHTSGGIKNSNLLRKLSTLGTRLTGRLLLKKVLAADPSIFKTVEDRVIHQKARSVSAFIMDETINKVVILRNESALVIQCLFRRNKVNDKVATRKRAATAVAQKLEALQFKSASRIQRHVRGMQGRRLARERVKAIAKAARQKRLEDAVLSLSELQAPSRRMAEIRARRVWARNSENPTNSLLPLPTEFYHKSREELAGEEIGPLSTQHPPEIKPRNDGRNPHRISKIPVVPYVNKTRGPYNRQNTLSNTVWVAIPVQTTLRKPTKKPYNVRPGRLEPLPIKPKASKTLYKTEYDWVPSKLLETKTQN